MAVELGTNFPLRWQRSPVEFRQNVFDELLDVCSSLGGHTQERIIASPTRTSALPVSSAIAAGPVEQELKRSFLQNADDLIEQQLDSVRVELRKWLHGEMNRLLQDSLKKPE
ncbi:hypothetical protein EV700_0572 [Fluviicoccus keumensis]|uniref:Uncharacterized protein n=1 Tax=Fluviicoccus keumensis TaxID=1435465 RepID=A0A4Q7ZCB1_9GAMM|nr:hypothetical protein [Fluviicoccus keumensis]RZU47605.1 hypothetical protein EV700_0572 [Fluviicoccus keumensis]